MRILVALLIAALSVACDSPSESDPPPDDGRLPGHDFDPQPTPEPTPQPAPEPSAEPEPTVPVPIGEDGVFLGAGSVLVQLSGDEPFDGGGLAVVEVLDAAGALIDTREFGLNLYPVAMAWERQLWWPSDLQPARARVTLRSNDTVVRTAEYAVGDVPITDGGCDPAGFLNRCAADAICLAPDLESEGRCAAVSLVARFRGGLDPSLAIDLRADADPAAALADVTLLWDGGEDQRRPQAAPVDAGWRGVVRTAYDWFDAVTVYAGPHRLASDLRVEERPIRRTGVACDAARFIDTCEQGAACAEAGVCAPISAPVIEQIRATRTDDAVGFWIAGHDRDRDVDTIIVNWLGVAPDAAEAPEGWLYVSAHQSVLHSAIEYDAEGNFEGFWVHQPPEAIGATGVQVVLVDDEDQSSAPVEARFDAADPAPREPGQSCDVFGAISTCVGGATCDLLDGADRYRCVTPTPGCATPADWPAIEGDTLDSTTATGVDVTRGSCMRSRGNLGEDRGFSLTAERAGVHRIRVFTNEYATLSAITARRQCDLPGPASELACASDMGGGNGVTDLSIEVELAAGETVYLLVEATWIGGGPFTLSVERP